MRSSCVKRGSRSGRRSRMRGLSRAAGRIERRARAVPRGAPSACG
ncbi:hypothetical protein F8B43_1703 [Methylorubrum populi]|uniref:Uncharacterized protein n=1 Tax=Methylorubrum populi TaxID=223967 RepID=A0A833J8A9_9HYPH|nr:hypothetical protein F8B43_1703 [Methylorubrum populi]